MRFLLVGILLLNSACSAFKASKVDVVALEKVDAAESSWHSKLGSATGYTFSYSLGCFCLGPNDYTVKVENGVIVSAINHDFDRSTNPPTPKDVTLSDFKNLLTIESYFTLIRRAIAQGGIVTFSSNDAELVPSAGIDWVPRAVDDEEGITISNIQIN